MTDVSTRSGLVDLDTYLLTHSYMDGYTPSQSDVSVFAELAPVRVTDDLVNLVRWYNHIASFNAAMRAAWPGKKATAAPSTTAATKAASEEEGSDFDFSDDDSDDGAAAALIAKKKAEADAKKKKAKPAAKSSIIFDVKPWGEETDMKELEQAVRAIDMDGLRWAGSQLEEIAFGVMKLRINAVVEDDKIGTDDLEERIVDLEDMVQSVDIYAFNKL